MSEQILADCVPSRRDISYWNPSSIKRVRSKRVAKSFEIKTVNLFYDVGDHDDNVYYLPQLEINKFRQFSAREVPVAYLRNNSLSVNKVQSAIAVSAANSSITFSILGLFILVCTVFVPLLAVGFALAIGFSLCSKHFFQRLQ